MPSNSLLELAKKVIRNAGEIGLETAGQYVCGPAWPYAKKMLSPVIKELEKRYPKLFLLPEDTQKALEALSTDKVLQELLHSGFAKLESGQEEILTALIRQNDTLIQIGAAIESGFRTAGEKVDAAFVNISHELSTLKLEMAMLRDIDRKASQASSPASGISIADIHSKATSFQHEAVHWLDAGRPNIAAQHLSEARNLLEAGLQRNPDNTSCWVAFGYVEKTQARVAQLLGDHDGHISNLAKATKYFATALRHDPKNVESLTGMANIYALSGDYDRAIELGRLAVRSDPNYGSVVWGQWLDKALTGIEIPTGLKYSDQHAWISIDDEVGTVGITDFFRFTQNPDWVWVDELPRVGLMVEGGQIISKITGLVNPEVRKQIYPKSESWKIFSEEMKTFKNSRGSFRDPRRRIWISVPSPVSGQVVKVNKPLIRKGREHSMLWPRQPLNLHYPYAKYSWLFRIKLNNTGWKGLEQLMGDTAYKQFVGSILIGGKNYPTKR